jgi:tRNA threonylcarbamoyladenosine biosynthesis protein TsaB
MHFFLCIETSTTVCSVALFDKTNLLSIKENNNGYTHAESLHPFIEEVLNEAGVSIEKLDAICVGKGPGSYTGLRIGVSAAKGIAYAKNIPLIGMNSLQNIVAGAINRNNDNECVFGSMIDARRMEVYFSVFNYEGFELKETSSFIINEESLSELSKKHKKIILLGDGAVKCSPFIEKYPNMELLIDQMPSAKNMGDYCFEKYNNKAFENVAYFEPFYLKEFFSGK